MGNLTDKMCGGWEGRLKQLTYVSINTLVAAVCSFNIAFNCWLDIVWAGFSGRHQFWKNDKGKESLEL